MSYFVRRVVILGGNWNNGGYTGPRCRNFNNSASTANANIGSRGQRCIGLSPSTAELMSLSQYRTRGRTHDTLFRATEKAIEGPLLVGRRPKVRGFYL